MRAAVIGGGISGLVSAYVLAKAGVEVVLYEKEDSLGGHAKTVTIDGVDLDLCFMVFNRVTYPNMMEFFESLGVDMEISDMSFSVSLDKGQGCEWSSRNGMSVCGSIWSCSSEKVMSCSAFSVLSFCRNHHALQIFGRPQWLTVRSRSRSYVDKVIELLESLGCQIKTGCEVRSVLQYGEGRIEIRGDDFQRVYDGCIMAVHAPDALRMLGNQATFEEKRVLGAFQYVYSDIFLHRDKNFMPRNPAAWSAWNFLGSTGGKVCLTYWLNVVQNIEETRLPFLVTLNPDHTPEHTLFKWSTSHPVPSVAASKASLELDHIQGKRGIWFCGAYQGYGFHEDGLKAGMIAAHGMLGKSCAILANPKHMEPSLMEKGARIFVARFLRQFISTGCLIFLEEGGTIFTFEGAQKNCPLKTVLRIHNPQFYWKVMTEADLGLADSYINGDFSFVDKDEGLLNLFLSEHEDLEVAQMRKVSLLIQKARVSKGHEVLEIGCGWGTLAIEIVKQTGCKYTGITLSEEQLKYAEMKVKEAGLQDHIRLYLCDYRQLPKANKYDRIISCEMIEAVGHDYMEEFFGCCESLLAEHGLLLLQFISVPDQCYDEHRLSPGFIKEYIFPGGCLPSLNRITSAMTSSSRLCVEDLENIGIHYYQTLRCWRKNFLEKQSKILALGFSEKFIRTWEYYFDYCAAGFKSRTLGDYQFQIPFSLEPFFNNSKLKVFSGECNEIFVESESSHSMTPKFQLESVKLSGSGIHATFPKFLYNQHDLEYVDFSDSNLKGEFPNWLLENNTNLNTLVLRNNSLSGPFRMPIQPHWHLDTLHVSKNFFQGNIPLEIGVYFPRLVYLNLSRNDFNGSIPSSIGDMNSLKFLDLSHNQLTGEIPEHLVIGCFNLEYLVLSENSLHGQLFYKKIYLRKLARLHLDANYCTGEIPKSLSNCSPLEGLYMSDNNLYGNIPAWLGNLSSLNDIMMAINHLQGPIPLEFCQLNYLEILDLSENNISGTLPSCSSHSTIQQVHLSKNMLYGPLKYGTFFNRSSIVTLDLSYNSFSGNIPYWIERLTRLRYLILANNNLEGEVPNQLCRLKQLRLIDLSNNNLFGQIPGCLDNTSLHNNGDNDGSSAPTFNPNRTTTYFVGPSILEKEESEIPPQIGKLTSIRALNFSHNNLTGVIPVSFSNLKQVESLDVSYNNLNGKIPPQLVELNVLAVFSVAHNNLSGKIPEWTAQFTTFKEDSYEGNPLLCGKPLPDCDVAAVPEASNEEDGNSLIDMGSFYITFTSSYVIVILAIIGVLYVNPYWRRRWFYLIENWMTSCFYFIVDNLIPTRFYRASIFNSTRN
ncbi:Amino oxidase domain-containing protein [Citrus sinensis]|nr:Amino oxidase domain-containing protein [Citrus sinensis]